MTAQRFLGVYVAAALDAPADEIAMIELPFRLSDDYPAATGILALLLSLLFVGILFSYARKHRRTRTIVDFITGWWLSGMEEKKRFSFFRCFAIFMASAFFLGALFSFSVATGILKGKETPPPSLEQFIEQQRRR